MGLRPPMHPNVQEPCACRPDPRTILLVLLVLALQTVSMPSAFRTIVVVVRGVATKEKSDEDQ